MVFNRFRSDTIERLIFRQLKERFKINILSYGKRGCPRIYLGVGRMELLRDAGVIDAEVG
jgi:hypothetical protein